jgi:hypothetical protein
VRSDEKMENRELRVAHWYRRVKSDRNRVRGESSKGTIVFARVPLFAMSLVDVDVELKVRNIRPPLAVPEYTATFGYSFDHSRRIPIGRVTPFLASCVHSGGLSRQRVEISKSHRLLP